MSELKTCPFCGGHPVLGNFIVEAAVHCIDCRATVTRRHAPEWDSGVPAVITAWNCRAPADAPQGVTATGCSADPGCPQ